MKQQAIINVIRYDLIVKKPKMSYEKLMELKKQLNKYGGVDEKRKT